MPSKRQILESIKKNDLLPFIDRWELDVPDRRVKDAVVDALARSKKARIDDILSSLSRDSLKDVCRALDLDDSGRAKAELVDRILGRILGRSQDSSQDSSQDPSQDSSQDPSQDSARQPAAGGQRGVAASTAPAPAGKRGSTARAASTAPAPAIEPGGKLSRQALEAHLWAAADILRGSIDSSDYKNYIFGLLFLKRLSDVFEEEAHKLIAGGLSERHAWTDRDEHQFFVPERARWSTIQKATTNVGEALNTACAALEEQNAALEGVLAGIDYNDERKLGNSRARDTVLGRLVQHFSRLSLRNEDLSEPDLLGRAYEYLIEKFADDAGKKGGEFYTPRKVVQLIVELLAPAEGMRICDPTCGSGGMLIECAHYLERHQGNPDNIVLHGQEKNLNTWAICKMNMLLHGFPDVRIEKGDTIREPKLLDEGALLLYDRVIANPPFSLDEWGIEVAEGDGHGRFRYGIPPRTKGDLAFVQHMVAVLNKHGRMGVVMPHGVLFRGAGEGRIREAMLREDLFEAVIGLPANLFYGTGIPAAVLVLSRDKPRARKGKVLFVDGSREVEEGSNQNYLRDQDVQRIAAAFHAFKDVARYARVVGLDEIEKNEFNLNISRYVDTAEAEERIDVGAAVARLRELEQERAAAEEVMNRYLKELGYGE